MGATTTDVSEKADIIHNSLEKGLVVEAKAVTDPNDTDNFDWFITLNEDGSHCVGYNIQDGSTSSFAVENLDNFVEQYNDENPEVDVFIRSFEGLPERVRAKLQELKSTIEKEE